jgi:signal transduction histidine kinase
MLNSLSGRFLILTAVFVLIAEAFVLVPSVARYRLDYLETRLERAQLASLAVLADDAIDPELERELLTNAGVFNVVLRRDEVRQLALASPIPEPISATFDIRDPGPVAMVRDALAVLADPQSRIIRVIGNPVREGGLLIEITLETGPLRAAMVEYAWRILLLSAVFALVTAGLLFLAVRILLVTPIKGVVAQMTRYAAAPEDARRFITPAASLRELREAEESLAALQQQLTGALKQRERLAQLGAGVAKVSHDLRNILTSAQLFVDRIEASEDPTVRRLAPKLVGSLTRAITLCESTLAFGRVDEPPPNLTRVQLAKVVGDVLDAERLAAGEHDLSFGEDVPAGLTIRADAEQLYRVIQNLVRNARQAIVAAGRAGEIDVAAWEDDTGWHIEVRDTGPGLPPKAQEYLFQPFQGGVAKGGSGLGLTIAAELVRGHGGRLTLAATGPEGTVFAIHLPKADITLAPATPVPAAAE